MQIRVNWCCHLAAIRTTFQSLTFVFKPHSGEWVLDDVVLNMLTILRKENIA